MLLTFLIFRLCDVWVVEQCPPLICMWMFFFYLSTDNGYFFTPLQIRAYFWFIYHQRTNVFYFTADDGNFFPQKTAIPVYFSPERYFSFLHWQRLLNLRSRKRLISTRKTTFSKIVVSLFAPDNGSFFISSQKTVGF